MGTVAITQWDVESVSLQAMHVMELPGLFVHMQTPHQELAVELQWYIPAGIAHVSGMALGISDMGMSGARISPS